METLAAQITSNPCTWSLSPLPTLHWGDGAHRQHEGGRWGKNWMFIPHVITFLDLKSVEMERNRTSIWNRRKQLHLCSKTRFFKLCRLKGVSWASCEHSIVTYNIHQFELEGKFQTRIQTSWRCCFHSFSGYCSFYLIFSNKVKG